MRIFNWVQNRFNGRKEKKGFDRSSNSISTPYNPEPNVGEEKLGDWCQELLSIGTLGTNSLKKEEEMLPEISDLTIEEVLKLQKELSRLLKKKPKSIHKTLDAVNSVLINCSTNIKIDDSSNVEEEELGDLTRNGIMILRKARELLAQNRSIIRRKSFAFLLKNFVICGSGFAAAPCLNLRDPTVVSSIEKLLRIMLHKKIFPQSSVPMEVNKYLGNKMNEKVIENYKGEEEEDRDCKWDKTDSDFIVLEI